MNFLASIGTWLLKIFLGGLFNKVVTQIEDEAKAKENAAILHAKTTDEAAKVEIAVAKGQAEVVKKYAEMPKNEADPFNNDDWNKGTTK